MVKRQRSLKFPINVFTLKNVLRISYLQNGNMALHEAAWNGYSQCASVLLSANSNVNTHNKVRVVIWAHCTQGLDIGGVYVFPLAVQSVCECPAVSEQQYEYSQQGERGTPFRKWSLCGSLSICPFWATEKNWFWPV